MSMTDKEINAAFDRWWNNVSPGKSTDDKLQKAIVECQRQSAREAWVTGIKYYMHRQKGNIDAVSDTLGEK